MQVRSRRGLTADALPPLPRGCQVQQEVIQQPALVAGALAPPAPGWWCVGGGWRGGRGPKGGAEGKARGQREQRKAPRCWQLRARAGCNRRSTPRAAAQACRANTAAERHQQAAASRAHRLMFPVDVSPKYSSSLAYTTTEPGGAATALCPSPSADEAPTGGRTRPHISVSGRQGGPTGGSVQGRSWQEGAATAAP